MNKISVFNYTFKNQGAGSCEVYVDGIIVDEETRQIYADWFNDTTSVSYKSIRTQIADAVNAGCKTINCYINSGGGSVIEAMALHDYFVELQAKGIQVNTFGRGIIASAATYLLMAGNSTMSENSWFMIHNASGAAWGDVNYVENYAATLRKFNDQITELYCNATGMSKTVIGNMMDAETWMTGKEAKDKGFVKNCTTAEQFKNAIPTDKWMFKNTAVLQAYNSFTPQNSNQMDIKTIINGVQSAFIDALKEAGIIKDDQTKLADQLTNALDKALEPMNQGITDAVNDAVTAKLADMDTTVTNAVTEAIKNLTFATKDDITNAIKPVSDELEAVKNDVAAGAGSANPNPNPAPGTVHNAQNHPGITW